MTKYGEKRYNLVNENYRSIKLCVSLESRSTYKRIHKLRKKEEKFLMIMKLHEPTSTKIVSEKDWSKRTRKKERKKCKRKCHIKN